MIFIFRNYSIKIFINYFLSYKECTKENDGFSILYANDNPLSSLLLLVGTKYENSILLPSIVSESTYKSVYVLSLGKKVNAIGSFEINFFVLEFL